MVVGIRFQENGKIYDFDPGELTLLPGEMVVVETARGIECGTVARANRTASEERDDRKPVLRRATAEQMEVVRKYTAEQMGNVRKYTDEAREQINAGWDVTCAKAKDLHAAGEEYVKANPTGSVLGALGVGIILGLLLGSGRR
jgi:ElaB/YqjD/DUF883 family membrane-anchored ribosome-binding protein